MNNGIPKCSKMRQLFQVDATLKSVEWMLTSITPETNKDTKDRNDIRDILRTWRVRLDKNLEEESKNWNKVK